VTQHVVYVVLELDTLSLLWASHVLPAGDENL